MASSGSENMNKNKIAISRSVSMLLHRKFGEHAIFGNLINTHEVVTWNLKANIGFLHPVNVSGRP